MSAAGVRAELRIGNPGGNFVLVDCEVVLLHDGGAYPWRATSETGHEARAATRTAAVLALFAERLGSGEETWAALGGTDRDGDELARIKQLDAELGGGR